MDSIDKMIVKLVDEHYSTRRIATGVGRSQRSVVYRLKRMGLKTKKKPREDSTEPKSCTICKRTKSRHDFYARRDRNSVGSECKDCFKLRMSRTQKQKKLDLVREFGGECKQCGYDKIPRILHFHHTNPDTKLFNISQRSNASLTTLRKEAKKCILLCPNCHAEEHTA